MRHARPEDLAPLATLLEGLRRLDDLTERKPGNFSRGSKAFLHVHADPEGLFVDVRLATEFERFRVSTATEQRRVLTLIRRALRGRPA